MSYREYVPTCVETLFGRPPTKFKARAIIPESRTLNMPSGRCKCCNCNKHNSPKKISNVQEDYSGSDTQYKSTMNCPDCRKQINMKDNIVPCNEEYVAKRGYRGGNGNRRFDHSHYECYCTPQYDYTEDEYYPEERTRAKHKIIKKKNYYSEPTRSTDSADHSDSDRFCNVCKLWVRSDSKEYSSKRYEERGRVEIRKLSKGTLCPSGYHFVVESCKFCGNLRDGPSELGKKEESPCEVMQSLTQEICDLGKQVDQSSRSDGFFASNEKTETVIRADVKEMDSSDEIYERFAEEIAAMERYPEIPRDEELIEHNSQENPRNHKEDRKILESKKHPRSDSEMNNNEKQYENINEKLEDYKYQLDNELKEEPQEDSRQNREFRSCNCEYARKDWKVEEQLKLEPDKSEIRLLKQKCDEALDQLELFKREIAESRQEKCRCDLESTMFVVEDCKYRCAQLEKKVVFLQRTIDSYARPTRSSAVNTEGNREIRRNQRSNGNQRKPVYTEHERGTSRKRDQGREVIKANVTVSRKPKSTCPPVRERNFGCKHIRCFPPEQIPDIPYFKICPGYRDIVNKR